TDRLVVDLVAGGGVVVCRPLGDQREDEGRAGTGDLRGDLVARLGAGPRRRTAGIGGGGRVVATARGDGECEGNGQGGGAEVEAGRRGVHSDLRDAECRHLPAGATMK